MTSQEVIEPFPPLPRTPSVASSPTVASLVSKPTYGQIEPAASRIDSKNSRPPQRRRTSSLSQSFLNSNPPYGMWQATGEVASKIPTLGEIRKGSFCADGWREEGQMEERGESPHQVQKRRASRASSISASRHRRSTTSPLSSRMDEREEFFPAIHSQVGEETSRMPDTIPESLHMDGTADEKSAKLRTIPEPTKVSSNSDHPSVHSQASVTPDETGTYPNGYRFPPKHTWWQSTVIGLKAFWKFFCTPFGFLVTIYGLNVVGWGAMIFFVLLNAAPAMCHPTCNDNSSARKIWIEIDSQILNALFCVTGFGLIPWRFRDFYYLIQWRVFKKYDYFRRLAGHNRGWFRLPGSDQLDPLLTPPPVYNKKNPKRVDSPPEWSEEEIAELEKNPAVLLPATSMPPPPLTGVRAPPTKPIMIDVVVWMYVLNTVFQACLAGVMWGLNRFTRPGWVTGFLVAIACLVGIAAGVVVFREGKKIKKVEGIPVEEEEAESDAEKGQEALGFGTDGMAGDRSQGEKGQKALEFGTDGMTGDRSQGGKGQKAMEFGTDGMAGDRSQGGKGQNGHIGTGLDNSAGGGERPSLTRRTTEKTKGKYWFERH
jgi:Protein of unknown function (DUF2985)